MATKHAKLTVQTRSGTGRSAANKLRKSGIVPAVIYSGRETAVPLQVEGRALGKLLSEANAQHFLVDLEILGGEAPVNRLALFQAKQIDPLTRHLLHVDFHGISADEELTSQVAVESFGEPIGVKTFGGTLEQTLRVIEIACLPDDLPEIIRVDVSSLNVGDSLHLSQLVLPKGVRALGEPGTPVFAVTGAVAEDAPVAAEGGAKQPEILREKKPAEGAAAAGKAPAGKAPAAKAAKK
jgi:large subunit ribosomal protein L25